MSGKLVGYAGLFRKDSNPLAYALRPVAGKS